MLRALLIALCLTAPVAAQDFFTLKGHGGPIMDIAVSPSGQIATASFDNSVGVWDGATPKWFEGHRAAVNTVTFGRDQVPISSGDDFIVRVWTDIPSGFILGEHQAKVMDLAWSEQAGMVASASWDHTIGLWPLSKQAGSTDSIAPNGDGSFLQGHKKGVNDVAFAADGTRLYSASVDGTIRLWDVSNAKYLRTLVKHGFGINTLVLNEEQGWLAYGSLDGGTRMVDLETSKPIADFTLGRRPILAMAYHEDTAQLAVGDGEGFIMIIDTKARKITRDFRATKRGPIWALAFSSDGLNIHAGGIEDIMYSWPVESLTEHGQMSGETRSFLEDPDKLPNGERQFKRKCSICHTVTEGSARKAGPSLHQLFGRKAGTVEDYSYSEILTDSEIVWSAATINDLFDEGPDHYIPGTKMPMQRIVKQTDRDDLIAYLRSATAVGGE